jgi:hypothetical protein
MLQPRSDQDELLGQLAALVRTLGRYPTVSEMRFRKREHTNFPNHKVLDRLGTRREVLRMLAAYSERTNGWSDVATICTRLLAEAPEQPAPSSEGDDVEDGYVYLALMRVGREKRYEIGKANFVEQRIRQVAVNLPEELVTEINAGVCPAGPERDCGARQRAKQIGYDVVRREHAGAAGADLRRYEVDGLRKPRAAGSYRNCVRYLCRTLVTA